MHPSPHRWELLPPRGRPHVLRVRPTKVQTAAWAWSDPPRVPRDYDPRAYVNPLIGFESLLLPGERFVVERMVWNETKANGALVHYVFLRQEECFHGGMRP